MAALQCAPSLEAVQTYFNTTRRRAARGDYSLSALREDDVHTGPLDGITYKGNDIERFYLLWSALPSELRS